MKVAAAVVTHNRLADLKLCLASLRAQTVALAGLVVVDNGSTDGTSSWLANQNDLHLITQANEGSAGGFYTAISTANQKGFDLVYCVDDDCLVAPDAIANVLRARSQLSNPEDWVLTSYVFDPTSNHYGPLADFLHLDFSRPPVRCFYAPQDIPASHVREGVYLNWGHFFLGVLFPLRLLNKVGLPEKKYFIRGEDYEYLLRCLKLAHVGCVLNSRIHHGMSGPVDRSAAQLLDWKGYCQMRNHLYINRKYYPSYRNTLAGRLFKYASLSVRDALTLGKFDKLKALAFYDAMVGRFDRYTKPTGNNSRA